MLKKALPGRVQACELSLVFLEACGVPKEVASSTTRELVSTGSPAWRIISCWRGPLWPGSPSPDIDRAGLLTLFSLQGSLWLRVQPLRPPLAPSLLHGFSLWQEDTRM